MTESKASPLEIHLLGPFDARVRGERLSPLRTRKGQWLLALLILKQGRPLERDWLAGTLWPDSHETQARMSLRKSLNDLRQALGAQACRLHAPTPRTLAFDLSDAFADVARFDAAIARGEEKDLQQAVALYRGPLLENCQEEWVLLERQTREQAYLHALEHLAARAMERGDPAAAVERLRACVTSDPLRESAQRLLMEAHAAAGSFAAATEVYRDLRLLLRRALNAEPDAETRALYQRLRLEAQVPAPALADRKPSALSNLPYPISELIGRQEEIAAVQTLLTRARLVTLTGTGGVGKTRLAIEAAREAQDSYADGASFVDLAGLTDPS
ncbi:MAG TPA: BTAD domain-containing putative transcriptional regulator, partial [Chthonomonadaceae bacterium]|nr:BTAD domain-containing putative transcriptional regulator [Chthonomonadaceae bacterium]